MCMTLQVYVPAYRISSTHCEMDYGSKSGDILVKWEEKLLFLQLLKKGLRKRKPIGQTVS